MKTHRCKKFSANKLIKTYSAIKQFEFEFYKAPL